MDSEEGHDLLGKSSFRKFALNQREIASTQVLRTQNGAHWGERRFGFAGQRCAGKWKEEEKMPVYVVIEA
jgi:hypothetical protein